MFHISRFSVWYVIVWAKVSLFPCKNKMSPHANTGYFLVRIFYCASNEVKIRHFHDVTTRTVCVTTTCRLLLRIMMKHYLFVYQKQYKASKRITIKSKRDKCEIFLCNCNTLTFFGFWHTVLLQTRQMLSPHKQSLQAIVLETVEFWMVLQCTV